VNDYAEFRDDKLPTVIFIPEPVMITVWLHALTCARFEPKRHRRCAVENSLELWK